METKNKAVSNQLLICYRLRMALDMLLAGPSTILILLFSWAILKVKPNSVTDYGPFCPISRIT